MAIPFLNWLTRRQKSLASMTRQELRRQELLLDKRRQQLLRRIERITQDKQQLFERGAHEKSVEVRRVYAQEFEMKTAEQIMLSRQLNIRSKETMTVSRLRMLRENAEQGRLTPGRVGFISSKDLVRLGKLIENDAITAEMYQDRLDEVLALGAEIDEGQAGLTEAGQTVMDIWGKMDAGSIQDKTEAFDEADRRVRERQAAAEE